MNYELKPCPLCHSSAEMWISRNGTAFVAHCTNPDCATRINGYRSSAADAIKAWDWTCESLGGAR